MDPNAEPPGYKPPQSAEELLERYAAGERDFQTADLQWAILQDADLEYSDLQRANLQGANLQRAGFQQADLKRAMGTRRVSGPLTVLRERLASAGQDYIEELGSGPGGTRYRFRVEML